MNTSRLYSRIIDLIVLTSSFLLLTAITDIGNPHNSNPVEFSIYLFCFVAVMFISLRLSKRIIFQYLHTSSQIARVLLGNITGLVVGAALVMFIEQFFMGLVGGAMIVVFSSILAFFILGTLSPMVKSSQRDIIHH